MGSRWDDGRAALGDADRALERWIGEDLARQHQVALTAELPETWLSMIAAADRAADRSSARA